MISDKERAVLELASKKFKWSEIPGSDYLRDLITEADNGGSEEAVIQAFMFGYLRGRMAAQMRESDHRGPIN